MSLKGLTNKELLLYLCAISGEYPVKNVGNLIQSSSVRDVVSELQQEGLIKKVKLKDGVKVFRLSKRGKQLLINNDDGRFLNYLYGSVNTNRIPTDMRAKKRLISYAEVYTMMYHAGVLLFDTEKPDIFPESSPQGALAPAPLDDIQNNPDELRLGSGILSSQPLNASRPRIVHPSFYTTRDYVRPKEWEGDDYGTHKPEAVKCSRSRGILLTPTEVFCVYNTSDSMIEWGVDIEGRWKSEIERGICNTLMKHQYHGQEPSGLVIGKDMEILKRYLLEQMHLKGTAKFFDTFKNMYYITNDPMGMMQLKLIIDHVKLSCLKQFVMDKFLPVPKNYHIECDAVTGDGQPVIVLLIPSIPRLLQYMRGVKDKKGVAVCFDYQREVFAELLGENVQLRGMKPEGVDKMFSWGKGKRKK